MESDHFEDNEGNSNVGFGFVDETGKTAEEVQNKYEDNECEDNVQGASDPEGLCDE